MQERGKFSTLNNNNNNIIINNKQIWKRKINEYKYRKA